MNGKPDRAVELALCKRSPYSHALVLLNRAAWNLANVEETIAAAGVDSELEPTFTSVEIIAGASRELIAALAAYINKGDQDGRS